MTNQPPIKVQDIKRFLDQNPKVKVIAYIGLGLVGIYVAGKVFSALASSVRGFKDLASALSGR